MPAEVQARGRLRDRRGLPGADRRPRARRAARRSSATGSEPAERGPGAPLTMRRLGRPVRRRARPRGGGLLPRRPRGAERAASGSRWPAAWRSLASAERRGPGSASAPASPRCSRRSRSSARRASAIPLTQALTAPLLGPARGARLARRCAQMLACAAVRLIHNTATTAFFIWVITGGLDAYAGTYDAIGRRLGLDIGSADALVLTAAGLLAWAAFASVVQVLVYRRGLARWDELADAPRCALRRRHGAAKRRRRASRAARFDPRAVALAAAVAFGLLLSSTAWPLLGGRGALARARVGRGAAGPRAAADRPAASPRVLAGGALVFALGGGLGLDAALRRALRAAPARAGRHLAARRPPAPTGCARSRGARSGGCAACRARPRPRGARRRSAPEGRLAAAGRALLERSSRGVPTRGRCRSLDAVLGWVVAEAARSVPRRRASACLRSARAGSTGARDRGAVAPGRRGGPGLARRRAGRDQQVVEQRRRQPRLEQRAVERLQQQVAAVGVDAPAPTAPRPARRWPRACGWPSRTGSPPAPRRSRARRSKPAALGVARQLGRA